MIKTQRIQCPRCGGTLTWEYGRRLMVCDYCNGLNVLAGSSALSRSCIPEKISIKNARRKAERIIRETPGVPSGFSKKVVIEDPKLYFVPYYEISGLQVGTVLQNDPRKGMKHKSHYKPGSGSLGYLASVQRIKESDRSYLNKKSNNVDTRVIMGEVSITSPAVDLKGWGIRLLNMDTLRKEKSDLHFEAFDIRELQKRSVVISPEISPEQVIGKNLKDVFHSSDAEKELLDKEISLIYYPFWRITYLYNGMPYHIVLDAVQGKRMYSRFPQNENMRILAFLAGIGLLGFLAGNMIEMTYVIFTKNIDIFNSMGFALWWHSIFGLPFLLAILAYIWPLIRFPGEIEYLEDVRLVTRIGKKGDTLPEKILKTVRKYQKANRRRRRRFF